MEHVIYDNYILKAECYIARQEEYDYLSEDIGFAIEPGVIEALGGELILIKFLEDLLLTDTVEKMIEEWIIGKSQEISIKRTFDSFQLEGEEETYIGSDMNPLLLELVIKQTATAKTMSPFLFSLKLKN